LAFHRLPDLIGELCNIHPFDHFISGPGKITVASGLLEVTYPILLNNSVAFARAFNLATPINLLTHYAKGTLLFSCVITTQKFPTAYRVTNSSYFTVSCIQTLISNFPLQYFFSIAKFIVLSLRGWFPYIPTSLHSLYFYGIS